VRCLKQGRQTSVKTDAGRAAPALGRPDSLVPAMLSGTSQKLSCRMQFLHCDSCPAAGPGPPM
ncbi:unnamed protein product, partial [Coccothraustes coccothraustes]